MAVESIVPLDSAYSRIVTILERSGLKQDVYRDLKAHVDTGLKQINIEPTLGAIPPLELFEKSLLWMSLCSLWKKTESLQQKKQFTRLLSHLYRKSERSHVSYIDTSKKAKIEYQWSSSELETFIYLAYLVFPYEYEELIDEHTKCSIQEAKIHFCDLLDIAIEQYGSYRTDSAVLYAEITAHFSEEELSLLSTIVKEHCDIDSIPFALSSNKYSPAFILYLSEPDQADRNHERNHLRFPGYIIGELGDGLNEVITELLAHSEVVEIGNHSFSQNRGNVVKGNTLFTRLEQSIAGSRQGYPEECVAFLQLCKKDPKLWELLINRYKERSFTTVIDLAVHIFNWYGPEAYIQFFLFSPHKQSTIGRISAENLTSTIKKKRRFSLTRN